MISISTPLLIAAGLATVLLLAALTIFFRFGSLWLQAVMSGANVTLLSLIGMSLRRVNPRMIVTAKIMGLMAGLSIDRRLGITTEILESHFLAGGDVIQVMSAIIAARQAGIDLDFERAAAMDLAGRDILDAVQTSVFPKVIDCPELEYTDKTWLSAISKDGIELRVSARVTVRTCMDQLIGGATEKTIVARVGQGIISAIGGSESYINVLSMPDQISRNVLARGLDSNTAFEIVSIDIAKIDVGDNIGARLQTEQAEADTRMAQAVAESRRANAVARRQFMLAEVTRCRAELIRAEANIPIALAQAFRSGQLQIEEPPTDFPRIRKLAE